MSSNLHYFGLFGESSTPLLKKRLIDKDAFENGEIIEDDGNDSIHFDKNHCVICHSLNLKYKCPECDIRTCSLECVKKHKKKFDCSGKKNKISFKKLAAFDDNTFLQEDCDRFLDNLKRNFKTRVKSHDSLPSWLKKLVYEAKIRGTKLKILPAGFSKRIQNKTAFMYSIKQIYWDVEFKFNQLTHKNLNLEQNVSIICNRISEKLTLKEILNSIFNPNPILETNRFKLFSLYRTTDFENIVAHLEQGKNLIKVDSKSSLKNILSGKEIVEYPTFYISLIKSDSNFLVDSNQYIESNEYDPNI